MIEDYKDIHLIMLIGGKEPLKEAVTYRYLPAVRRYQGLLTSC